MRRQLGFRLPRGEERPGPLLRQVNQAWQRAQRAALADVDLTPAQFALLQAASALHAAGERVTQRRLAAEVHADAMMTSQVVRALEDKGCLSREADPDDARALLVAPTRAGRKTLAHAIRRADAADAAFFAPLGNDAPRLVELLRRLAPADEERTAKRD